MSEDADDHALSPCRSDQGLDFLFARVKEVLVAFLGKQEKAREVAEAIVVDRHDLTCEFALALMRVRRNAVGVRRDRDRIAPESVDAPAEIRDIPNEDGIPAIGGQHLGEAPLHDSETVFLKRKHDFGRRHRDANGETAGDIPPIDHLLANKGRVERCARKSRRSG